ncbi:MAG: hypothetical protein QOF82_2551 [Frankiales bacterium]|nr:hypothetical protein [Frankiales bacterium]MDX6223088.1 hypothetical protein [Frankiales bacterium]
MGVLQRFERRLEGLVEGAFARAFKGNVEPVEIAAALEREALDKKAIVGAGRVLVPNEYVVELGDADYARLSPYAKQLGVELATMVEEAAAEQQWSFLGEVAVTLEQEPSLDTGMFHVRSNVVDASSAHGGLQHRGGVVDPNLTQIIAAKQDPHVFTGNPRLVVSSDGTAHAGSPEANGFQRATPLVKPATIIGRGQDADLRLSDPGVSRHHAQVELRDGGAWVEDLGSTNGTTLDGSPVSAPTLMNSGQRIALGSTVLVFLRDPDGS